MKRRGVARRRRAGPSRAIVAAIAIGSRIYSNSLLRMGARVTLAEALRG